MVAKISKEVIDSSYRIEEKRFYVPYKITDTCPKCKTVIKKSLWKYNYLSYPPLEVPFDEYLYCSECDTEWKIEVLLKISLELV